MEDKQNNKYKNILEKGKEVFGNSELFYIWWTTKNFALGGKSPSKYFMETEDEKFLLAELGRIEHGVY